MKSSKLKFFLLVPAVLCLVAWSPPAGENIYVGTGNNIYSPAGLAGAIGNNNQIKAESTWVVGDSNNVAWAQPNPARYSIVAGTNNVLTGGRNRNLVSGNSNTVNATNSFVSGENNTIDGFTVGSGANNVGVIGSGNLIASPHGWTTGYYNEIAGDYGMALGYSNIVSKSWGYALGAGLRVTEPGAVAIGVWNAPMIAGDVLAVGTGVNLNNRSTALRVTNNGGVILGRAQGDISMGDYGN